MTERLRAGARFLLGVAVVFVANLLAAGLSPALGPSLRRFDLIYRPLLALMLLVGFSLLLAAVDKVEGRPLAAMGLGCSGPWWRDCWIGLVIGSGTVAIAVSVVAVTGTLVINVRLGLHAFTTQAGVLVILLSGALAEELMFRG